MAILNNKKKKLISPLPEAFLSIETKFKINEQKLKHF
jgi:hypothetical protein